MTSSLALMLLFCIKTLLLVRRALNYTAWLCNISNAREVAFVLAHQQSKLFCCVIKLKASSHVRHQAEKCTVTQSGILFSCVEHQAENG